MAIALHAREEGLVTRDGVVVIAQRLWNKSSLSTSSFDERLEIFSLMAQEAGFVPAEGDALDAAVQEVIREMKGLVLERGMGGMGPLMGAVMARLGGAADGRAVSEALKKAIVDTISQ